MYCVVPQDFEGWLCFPYLYPPFAPHSPAPALTPPPGLTASHSLPRAAPARQILETWCHCTSRGTLQLAVALGENIRRHWLIQSSDFCQNTPRQQSPLRKAGDSKTGLLKSLFRDHILYFQTVVFLLFWKGKMPLILVSRFSPINSPSQTNFPKRNEVCLLPLCFSLSQLTRLSGNRHFLRARGSGSRSPRWEN